MKTAESFRIGAVALNVTGRFRAGIAQHVLRPGAITYTVVVKATYRLQQGTCVLLGDGDRLREEEEPWRPAAGGSIRHPADLGPRKRWPEVLLVGDAHRAADAQTARVRLLVGSVDKSVSVSPLRRVAADGRESVAPFHSLALSYEHAAVGPDGENPYGIDPTRRDELGRIHLPALTLPGVTVTPGAHVACVGFGPLGRAWPARARRLRPEDAQWLADSGAYPRPAGFDEAYYNDGPSDQWLQEPLRPDERIIVEGIDPETPRFVTNLPGIVPQLRCEGPSGLTAPDFFADTMLIDGARAQVIVTHRATLELANQSPVVELTLFERNPQEEGPTLRVARRTQRTMSMSASELPPDLGPQGGLPFLASSGEAPVSERVAPAEAAAPLVRPRAAPSFGPPPPLAKPQPIEARVLPPLVSHETMDQPVVPAELAAPFIAPPQPPRVPAPPAEVAAPRVSAPAAWSAPLVPRVPVVAPTSAVSPPAAGPERPSYLQGASAGNAAGAPVGAAGSLVRLATGPDAGVSSARSASDAAADRSRDEVVGRRVHAKRAPAIERRALVDLLGFEPTLPRRLRREASLTELFAASRVRRARVGDGQGNDGQDDVDERDVLRVLSLSSPERLASLRAGTERALADLENFKLPLFVVQGVLRPSYDRVEALRVAVAVAQPHAGRDKRVASTIALVEDALAGSTTPSVKATQSLTLQLEQALASLSLPSGYVSEAVESTLLEQRKYRRRALFGGTRLRCELDLEGTVFPVYLQEEVASRLPLLTAFPVLAIVELRPREDAAETHTEALLALAVARVVKAIG